MSHLWEDQAPSWGRKKGKEKEKKNVKQVDVGEEYITFQVDEEQYNFDTLYACNADANDN